MIDRWDRQPKETMEAFQAFAAYRDLGDERSGAKVAKALGKSTQLINRGRRGGSGWRAPKPMTECSIGSASRPRSKRSAR